MRDRSRLRQVVAVQVGPRDASRMEADVAKAWPGAKVLVHQGEKLEF